MLWKFSPPALPVPERHSISITIPNRPSSLPTHAKVDTGRWALTLTIKARLYRAAHDYELGHLYFWWFHFIFSHFYFSAQFWVINEIRPISIISTSALFFTNCHAFQFLLWTCKKLRCGKTFWISNWFMIIKYKSFRRLTISKEIALLLLVLNCKIRLKEIITSR
jgi:hypothetical protein